MLMTPRMDAEAQRHEACCELISEVARICGKVRLKVTGSSMLPAVRPGDVVTVRRCQLVDLQPGQIVLFGRREKLTAHRVKQIAEDHLIAQGDSLPCSDPPVKASEIVGQVVSIVRNGRLISPDPSLTQRIVAAMLRHSGPCRRILLMVDTRLPRLQELRLP